MYQETLGSRKAIGDIDVVYHDGYYHLFHLVLPNHDFIAHAISDDGFSWHRVRNALFIGHPGSWDDSMLWTMHVARDPWHANRWRMFYTGISQHDNGLSQRIGVAYSDDLYTWNKGADSWISTCRHCHVDFGTPNSHSGGYDEQSEFPIEATGPYYEHTLTQGRHWISWRDPYYFNDGDHRWLLIAARVAEGPIIRRGCVALLEEVEEGTFAARPPLFHDGLYDDIEVPNLFTIEGRYYLIGSLREDAKVRYWYSDAPHGPWSNFSDNVLLPPGNYAARITRRGDEILLWSFYTRDPQARTANNLVLAPKKLSVAPDGQLIASSFDGFDDRVVDCFPFRGIDSIILLIPSKSESSHIERLDDGVQLTSRYGFQGFLVRADVNSFRLGCHLSLHGEGKCGLLFRLDAESQDGYYLSLDIRKGVAQLRSWRTNYESRGEEMMQFTTLQAGYWRSDGKGECDIRLIAFGSYLELSVDGAVVLALADKEFDAGMVGVYAESASISITNIHFEQLKETELSGETLTSG